MRTLTFSSSGGGCHNPSLELTTKAKRVTRVQARRSVKECEDED
jgi:hypothetical protein